MSKQQHRIRNWSDYNAALVNRGRITLWFDEESINSWFSTTLSGKKGRPCTYSDSAMTCLLLIDLSLSWIFESYKAFLSLWLRSWV